MPPPPTLFLLESDLPLASISKCIAINHRQSALLKEAYYQHS